MTHTDLISRTNLVLTASLGSATLLVGAWIFQYFGFEPCRMCVWQRWPHGAAVAIGIFALLRPCIPLIPIGAVAAATSGTIGVYHSGVERGIWEGPATCSGNETAGLSPEQLLERILDAPLVRCDEVAWQMLGITIPNINAAFSFVLVVVWLTAAWVGRK